MKFRYDGLVCRRKGEICLLVLEVTERSCLYAFCSVLTVFLFFLFFLQGFDSRTSRLFTPKDFIGTYTTCYDMCTQRSPYNWSEQLYDRHGETISQVRKARKAQMYTWIVFENT